MEENQEIVSAQGVCPVCQSESISYGAIELDGGDGVYYPAECEDCGATWHECYNLEFSGVAQVQKEDE